MQDKKDELLEKIKDASRVLQYLANNSKDLGMTGKIACVDASDKFLPMLYELIENSDSETAHENNESMTRSGCLESAMECVCKSRERDYGTPEDSFACIGRYWSTHLGVTVNAHDVAIMMALLKIARIDTGRGKFDSYVDAAGYVACAVELRKTLV